MSEPNTGRERERPCLADDEGAVEAVRRAAAVGTRIDTFTARNQRDYRARLAEVTEARARDIIAALDRYLTREDSNG